MVGSGFGLYSTMRYTEITNDVRIIVLPAYVEQESDPVGMRHVFSYTITIENQGPEPVQLMKRHWLIKDSNGESYEVKGEGVIGKQPLIKPGASHTYSSFCVLKSFRGSMEGYYEMAREDGSVLYATIPKFVLSAHSLN